MLEMKQEHKHILIVLILAILIILLYKMSVPQMTTKLVTENFNNTTYPSVSCKQIKLSSTDNNIYLFGILFYDESGKLVDPNTNGTSFDSSSVLNKSATTGYYPHLAAKGIYNSFIKTGNISRNLLSLQNTWINYNTSDNAININFTDNNGRAVNLPTSFGTWNINPKSTWVSATADTYTNGIGNSYWTITFPTQIKLSAIELIGFTSINTNMKVEITDSNNKTTFTQILPKTGPRDYYRQIVMPCQFYINIPDSKGNTTNNYVNYSAKGYLTSQTVKPYSTPDSFFIMPDSDKSFKKYPLNLQMLYSGDGQNKFIYYESYDENYAKAEKLSSTTTYYENENQVRIFTVLPINTAISYYFGSYNNFSYLRLYPNSNTFSSTNHEGGALIKLIPINNFNQIITTAPILAPTTTQASTTTRPPITIQSPITTLATTTQIPNTTRAPITTLATTTQAPTTTPFTTIPYNTQYLRTIQNQIDNGYSMLNNNRFTIMDNQLKLDSLNSRVNKLLSNINKINNISNQDKTQPNNLTFY